MTYIEQGVLPGIKRQRSTVADAILKAGELPSFFPMAEWNEAMLRYTDYWRWFDGEALQEEAAVTRTGETIYQFPLHINTIRNFSRKHGALLIGEGDDEPLPPITTVVQPRTLTGKEASEDAKVMAETLQGIVNTVWQDSYGRALQMEAAVLAQFLGGYVFKVEYDPFADDLMVPIRIRGYTPDFFLPVWNTDDPYWLHEAFLVYRVPASAAKHQYGCETTGLFATYCEHWTRDTYSIYINGEAIDAKPLPSGAEGGVGGKMENLKNPFGFVPFVYLPVRREGNFFGPSIVEDIRGLVREYNARLADQGDAINETVHRERYMRNVGTTIEEKQLASGKFVTDLGQTNPATKANPEVFTEDPPMLSESLTNFARETLWSQLMREGDMGPVLFGEDEGSQRSGLTLAIRFWPATSRSHVTRTHFSDGMNVIAQMILMIVEEKNLLASESITVPKDFRKRYIFSQRWQEMIPRDREQLLNEAVLAVQSNIRSRRRAVKDLGGVSSVEDELAEIKSDMKFVANLSALGDDQGEGPATEIVSPTASSGLSEKD